MALSFASSALIEENFDLIRTAEEARGAGFPWVQLFVDSASHDPACFAKLAGELARSDLNIIVHLPDLDKLQLEDVVVAERLENLFPGRDVRTLIHYDSSLSADNIPQVNGKKVAIENSKTGVFDKVHVAEAYMLAREAGTAFVFDIGRIMYADENNSPEDIFSFISEMLGRLDPLRDIVHVAGKTSWTKKFRECSCALGSEGDIHRPIIPLLKDFSESGGVVVFENEDLEQSLDSVDAFRPQPY